MADIEEVPPERRRLRDTPVRSPVSVQDVFDDEVEVSVFEVDFGNGFSFELNYVFVRTINQ